MRERQGRKRDFLLDACALDMLAQPQQLPTCSSCLTLLTLTPTCPPSPAPPSRRFSLPLQTIDSSASLASMFPGGGEGELLRPLGHPGPGPSPLGLPAGQSSAPSSSYARSHSGVLTAGEGSVGGGSTASLGHEEHVGRLSPFAAPAAVATSGP